MGSSTFGPTQISDGTDTATIRDLANSDAIDVSIVDANGDQITSFGGGTQYTEDAAAAANPTGTAPILVRQDAPGALVSADGDNVAQRGTNFGAAFTQIVTSSGAFVDTFGGGVQYTEGDVDASITGTAAMWEDSGNTLRAVSVALPLPTQISDGTRTATVRDTGASDSLNVAIVDAAGAHITSFGGGTQYTEDVAAAADPVGTAQILVRQDTPATLVSTDGDNVARRGTNFGAAYTQVVTSSGAFVDTFGGGTQYTEGDVDATITGTAAMMEVAGNTLQPVQGTVADGLLVNLGTNNDVTVNNAAGASAVNIQDGGNTITVDGTVAVSSITTSVTPGTAAVNLGKAEDAAHASGDVGVMALAVRNDAATVLATTNLDYSPISCNSFGAIYVGSVIPGTTATELGKAEDAAHASADTGVATWAVRNDNLATSFSGATGDYTPKAVNAQGGVYKAVYRSTTTLTALNVTYDDSPTSATSASVDCVNATKFCFMYELTESGTATDITITPEVSDDDSAFFPMREWKWVKYRFDDATIAAYGTLDEGAYGEIIPRYLRFVATATGTTGANTFTIANARVTIMNG